MQWSPRKKKNVPEWLLDETKELTYENSNEERAAVKTDDQFVVQYKSLNTEVDLVKEGKRFIQDLLTAVQKTNPQEALPQAITLLELAVVTPLTSVHCKRVFS